MNNHGAQCQPSVWYQPNSLEQNKCVCLCVCLFIPAFGFAFCLCLYTFLLMVFSSVSLTLAIFCLVDPNVPLCLSAATIELIYVYLPNQEVKAKMYVYIRRVGIAYEWLPDYQHTHTEMKVCFVML